MTHVKMRIRILFWRSSLKERRRGTDLEAAILDAAWHELATAGYSSLTMDAVATRAGTSRPVLARRWSGRNDLALAAIRHEIAKYPVAVSPGSNLREELLTLLQQASRRASAMAASTVIILAEMSTVSGTSPEDVRATLAAGETSTLEAILERGIARGEVAAKKLKPGVATLILDLMRFHMIMHRSAPSPELMLTWLDDIFVPLIRPSSSERDSSAVTDRD
jgi:AcrR family transcriptional regulator